jgi:hypothetical protein
LAADVTKPKHTCPVADDGDVVPLAGQLIRLLFIFLYLETGLGYTRRVPYVEVLEAPYGALGHDLHLPSVEGMVVWGNLLPLRRFFQKFLCVDTQIES